jgi:hypothetical protein
MKLHGVVALSLLVALPCVAQPADGGAPRKGKWMKGSKADAGLAAADAGRDAGAPAAAPAAITDTGSSRSLAPAANVAPPTSAEAKKVIDYYYRGRNQGPLLVELVPCLKVDNTEGPTKSECLQPVTGPVKKGTTVNAWTLWIVPDGGSYDDLVIQWLLDGQVRSTTDVKLTEAFRSRTWRPSAMHRTGTWEIKAIRGDKTLGTATVTVID